MIPQSSRDNPRALIGNLERLLRMGALGLVSIGLALVALFIFEERLEHSARASRELIGLGRRAEFLAVERQSAARGHVVLVNDTSRTPGLALANKLGFTVDSLVALSSGSGSQKERAAAIREAAAKWERGYVAPLLAGIVEPSMQSDHAVAGEQLFEGVKAALTDYLDAEERIYASRLGRQAMLDRASLGGLLLLVGFVIAGMSFYSRRLLSHANSVVEQRLVLARQAATLVSQAESLEQQAMQLRTAEAGRAKSESLLNLLLDASPVGIGLFDSDLRLSLVNEAMAEMNARPKADLIGRTTHDLVDPDLAATANEILRSVLETGEPVHNAVLAGSIASDPGTERHYLVNYFPVRSVDEAISGVGIVTIDTTDRLMLERRLAESQKMEAVGRLAGGVAHDFNNMLTAIRSYSELVLDELDEESTLHSDVTEINRAAVRAAALTQQLLAFSRQQLLRPERLDLNQVVSDMEKMLRRLAGPAVNTSIHADPDVWKVKADPVEIERIIVNLVLNARDAMPDGGSLMIETSNVELTDWYVEQHPEASPGPHAVLAVTDSGSGMTRDVRQKLFEPFFTTKKRTEGTGLGLSSIYGIVKQSGGHITVTSEPGRGTRFEVYLPRDEGKEDSRQDTPAARPARDSAVILLVEDDEMVRAVTRRILTRGGYDVIEAANGVDALEQCQRIRFEVDLVLTDIEMPEMNGAELAERLRIRCPDVRILYMSGYTEDKVMREKLIQPGAPFLEKPFTPAVLLEKVREVLMGLAVVD